MDGRLQGNATRLNYSVKRLTMHFSGFSGYDRQQFYNILLKNQV